MLFAGGGLHACGHGCQGRGKACSHALGGFLARLVSLCLSGLGQGGVVGYAFVLLFAQPAALLLQRVHGVAAALADDFGAAGVAAVFQNRPGLGLFLGVDPGHGRRHVGGVGDGLDAHVGRQLDGAAGDGHGDKALVDRARHAGDEFGSQGGIDAVALDELLPLGAIGAVVLARDTGEGGAGAGGDGAQLAAAVGLEVRVRPVGVDHADVFAGAQVIEHHAGAELHLPRGVAVAHLLRVVQVGGTLLDVGGHAGGDLGGDALGLFVVLEVVEAIEHAGEHRHAAHLADAIRQFEVQHAVGADALGGVGAEGGQAVGGIHLVEVVGDGRTPGVELHALDDVALVQVHGQVVGLQHLDGERHAGAVLQAGHAAADELQQGLAVA